MAAKNRRHSKDDQARRLAELALTFSNAEGPLTSEEVQRTFYPELDAPSFRRAFLRDREKLSLCGLVIQKVSSSSRTASWVVNDSLSYALPDLLGEDDAKAITTLCSPLAEDPATPYGNDLRHALAKINRNFADSGNAGVNASGARSKVLSEAEACAARHHACTMYYKTASGQSRELTVAIYGFFTIRGNTYFVGPLLDDEHVVQDSIHTYRIDRIASLREERNLSYTIPPAFDVAQYVLPPFAIGPCIYKASFRITPAALRNAGNTIAHYGLYDKGIWTVPVSDERAAASWAVAQAMIPLNPESLVVSWKGILRGAVSSHASKQGR